eukprot:TRINITY_DN2195_c0_g1_i1.p1 TRINITY_DN2195_c0_g1~~TRINITY_DN2195_c0_g1_i1.p1  ORF type:complete len:128 (+),score=39.49 TRINITY_DN2195_c0_g1_i1:110-493(+)
MRLITHNMLMCNKGCTANNFPLQLVVSSIEVKEAEFNKDLVSAMLPKLDWSALKLAEKSLADQKLELALPEIPPAKPQEDEAFLKLLHSFLFTLHVQEGELLCKNCGRSFPIKSGIPNMLLNEDEIN